MIPNPHATRIAGLITQAQAGTPEGPEQIMDLLVAAAAICSRHKTRQGPEHTISAGLPFAVACAAEWFPPAAGRPQ